MRDVSPKVPAAALGAAFATIIWTIVASLSPGTFDESAVVALTGATGTILAVAFGYGIRDAKRQA